ncbi:Uncharacterised protein [[Clostridium] sordellii]|uniref:hypothetical protein n=1 Tax=Paraclostridium sordellii TaxID=1505 RepID=UPI0005E9A751|nr:hypothetical protein [Paeniclostridium sordellii]CEP50673.1 Uncharacterised protein [[Clostridium] sordellii] [Paeniclostridium sordellii]
MEYLQYDSPIFNIPFEVKTGDNITSQHMILPSTIDKSGSKDITNELVSSMIKSISSNKTLLIPKGIYLIKDLKIPSNLKMHCCEGSLFKLVPDAGILVRCVSLENVDNIIITGRISIDGNAKNQNTKNEHMHCLFLYDCHNIKIESVNAFNAVGDNVSISGGGDSEPSDCYSSNIKIDYIKATTAGRKNLVLEHVTNCYIGVAICDNSLGNNKGSGGHSLDVEPFDYQGKKICINTIKYLKTIGTGNDFSCGIDNSSRNYILNISVFDSTVLSLNTTVNDENNHEFLSAIYAYGITLNINYMRVNLDDKKHPNFSSWDNIANYPNIINCEYATCLNINSIVAKGGVPNSYIFKCFKNTWNYVTSSPSVVINSINCTMNNTKFASLNNPEIFIINYLQHTNVQNPLLTPFYSSLGNSSINTIS